MITISAVDCIVIGHNEIQFTEYERNVRAMGEKCGAYRDLNLSYVNYQGRIFTAGDLYNQLSGKIVSYNDTFSLTVAYLVSFLTQRGLHVSFVNSFQSEKEELKQILQNNEVRTVAITTTLYTSVAPILEIVSFVRRNNPAAAIIVGGPFIATQLRILDDVSTQFLLKTIGADYYIRHTQGEEALYSLIEAIKCKYQDKEINNLYYNNGCEYENTPFAPEDNKIENTPINWGVLKSKVNKQIALRMSSSCPFSCSFCAFPIHAGAYQITDTAYFEKELDRVESIGTIKSINFVDDTFNIPKKQFRERLRVMINKNYSFRWNSHFRCQYADEETVRMMKASGCEGVFLGIESGNEQVLKNMNKNADVDGYKRGIELLHKYEIPFYSSFIIGFPGETQQTVQDTIAFIKETAPTFFRTQLWYCDQETPIYSKRHEYGIQGAQFAWKHETMDYTEACDCIDAIFHENLPSTWLPQNNFDFPGIFSMLSNNHSIDVVVQYLRLFQQGVRDRLRFGADFTENSEAMQRLHLLLKPNTGDHLLEQLDVDLEF